LGEKFYWKIDGVTITLISIGTMFAVTQKPEVVEDTLTAENVSQVSLEYLIQPNSIIYVSILSFLLVWRVALYPQVTRRLDVFYQNVILHYGLLKNSKQV
jgi:hypothetical protein